jgi:hypothetical protein
VVVPIFSQTVEASTNCLAAVHDITRLVPDTAGKLRTAAPRSRANPGKPRHINSADVTVRHMAARVLSALRPVALRSVARPFAVMGTRAMSAASESAKALKNLLDGELAHEVRWLCHHTCFSCYSAPCCLLPSIHPRIRMPFDVFTYSFPCCAR